MPEADTADKSAALVAGSFAIFSGYSSPLEDGQTATLTEGDAVKIIRKEVQDGEDTYVVCKVNPDNGAEITQEVEGQDQPVLITDRLFVEELTPAKLETETPAAAEAPKARGKATAEAPAAETATETTAKAATKGGGKSKTTTAKKSTTAAKTPAKTEAKADTPPAAAAFTDVPSVKKLLESTDALTAAQELVNQREATDFSLGGVLHHIHETGVYKTLGYDGKRGFDDYVEQTLGVASRKARYLMGNYVTFATLGVDTDKLETIGWSKAKELARIPAEQLKKDYDKLVEMAGKKTREELTQHITTKYTVATRGTSVKTTAFNFRLAEDNGETVKAALARAKALAGENADDNAALLYMANDWMAGSPGSDMTLADMTNLMQETFGVTVTIADSEGNEVDPSTYVPEVAVPEAAEQEAVPA